MYTWLLWNQGIWREERENNLIIAFHLVPLYLVWHRFLSFTLPEVSGSGSPVDWTNFQSSARVGKKYFPGRAGWGNGSKTGLTTFLTHMQLNPLFSASWHTSAFFGHWCFQFLGFADILPHELSCFSFCICHLEAPALQLFQLS